MPELLLTRSDMCTYLYFIGCYLGRNASWTPWNL